MLTRFRVRNFLSFAEQADGSPLEFTMWPSKADDNSAHTWGAAGQEILNFAGIYGANASGKSNLLKAMLFMQQIVLGDFPLYYENSFCRNAKANRNKPSYFEVEIELAGKYYAYGFEMVLAEGRFTSEWLVQLLPNSEEKPFYLRDIEQGKCKWGEGIFTPQDKELAMRVNVYCADVCEDTSVLLLKVMNENKNSLYANKSALLVLKQCYEWIRDSWSIRLPEQSLSNNSYLFATGKFAHLTELMRYFDFDIKDIQLCKVSKDKVYSGLSFELQNKIKENIARNKQAYRTDSKQHGRGQVIGIRNSGSLYFALINAGGGVEYQEMVFTHTKGEDTYLASEESDGMKRVLDLLEVFLNEQEKTYVVDEVDRCLHPELSYKFVKTFLEHCTGKKVQLIVTTHETKLLDLALLRRDEIWLMEKDKQGNSQVHSLDRYKKTFDSHLQEAYAEGRYGGVPVFSGFFPLEDV